MELPVRLTLSTETGQDSGTEFEYYASDNTVLLRTTDSRGTHALELTGHEAYQLRDFLNARLPKGRR